MSNQASTSTATTQQPPQTQPTQSANLPRNAKISAILLQSFGASEVEDGVLGMLMEFAHRKSPVEKNRVAKGKTTD
jgi:hypothetical protein